MATLQEDDNEKRKFKEYTADPLQEEGSFHRVYDPDFAHNMAMNHIGRARMVAQMDRLFGMKFWDMRIPDTEITSVERVHMKNARWKVGCRTTVRVTVRKSVHVERTIEGYSWGKTKVDAYISAIKNSETAALKACILAI